MMIGALLPEVFRVSEASVLDMGLLGLCVTGLAIVSYQGISINSLDRSYSMTITGTVRRRAGDEPFRLGTSRLSGVRERRYINKKFSIGRILLV